MSTERVLQNQLTLPYCTIKLDGVALQPDELADLMIVEVEQNLFLPDMFMVRLHNRQMKWSNSNKFKIGAVVEISMGQDRSVKPLIEGEITALELDAAPGGTPTLTLRGFDRMHRLQRGRKTRTFMQEKDSNLVSKIAQEAGLRATVEDTGTVHPYILQNNQTNLEFLQHRAQRLGLELVVEKQKILLRKPSKLSAIILEWGQNLTQFVSRQTSSHTVNDIVVRSWDPKTKKEIVGKSSRKGSVFGSATLTSSYVTAKNQGEAQKMAAAIHDQLESRDKQVEGACLGDPNVGVGKQVEIKGVGASFNGKYYLTLCRHHYSPRRGYETSFEANGWHSNSLLELTRQESGFERINGLIVGLVSNIKDPEDSGKVKLTFPSMPEDNGNGIESEWARIATPMAGKNRGFFFLPEVGDEVLVGFENGDVHRPYVVGALWNGKDTPPKKNSEVIQGSMVKERLIKTLSGHIISFDDSESAPKISIIDKSGKNKIVIDTTGNKITLETDSAGTIEIKAPMGKVVMEAKDIELKGTASVKVEAPQVEIKGSASAKIGGAAVEISGDGTAKLAGGIVDIQSQAVLSVAGKPIKLN